MREAIALFAKAPIAGRVKTRLAPRLTAEGAASFHQACVHQVWANIRALVGPNALLFSDQPCDAWTALAQDHARLQSSGDLGDRMRACFADLHAEGFDRALIVGADSPTLPPDVLRQGLDLLVQDHDAVLGPTTDGGYYTVGCRRPHPGMFAQVNWSVETTLTETEAAFTRAGFQHHRLRQWWDIDTPDDFERLLADPPAAGPVADWLAANS